jgi:hypothetical protein
MIGSVPYVSNYLTEIYTSGTTIFMVLDSGTIPFGHKYGDGSQSKAQVGFSQHTLYGRDNVVVCIVTRLQSGMPAIVVRFST